MVSFIFDIFSTASNLPMFRYTNRPSPLKKEDLNPNLCLIVSDKKSSLKLSFNRGKRLLVEMPVEMNSEVSPKTSRDIFLKR